MLVNDSFPACLCPRFPENLVLTMVLGTYPILGLSEKNRENKNIKLFQSFLRNWVNEVTLSTGNNITQSLKGSNMSLRDDLTNCRLIKETIVKVLEKYKAVFDWQPEAFVIFGGFANCLKHVPS